jgi:ribosomal protein S25
MEPKLRLPFNDDYSITFSFGATSDNEEIKKKFAEWGIVGHNGIDYSLPEGTEVVAAADGKVIQSGENGDSGIAVTLEHSWGKSLYAHLKETKVSQDQEVKAGDIIGLSGKTGAAFGEHLHFAVKPNDADVNNGYLGFIDPSPYFRKPEERQVEPVVNQEEVQRQIEEKLQERLKTEQDERRRLANEARTQRRKDNLNQILEFVRKRKTVTNDDIRDLLHVSRSTATNYLTELVDRGMLKKEGERAGSKYSA